MRPLLLLALLAGAATADAPRKEDLRRISKWRAVTTPWKHLELAPGVELSEGHRSLRDRFPYIVAARKRSEAYALTERNLASFLRKNNGAPIGSGDAALEAVRTFVAGPLVTSAEAAGRVVAAARTLDKDLGVKIHDYRPRGYTPLPVRMGKDKPARKWKVSLVALEYDGRMSLVHVEAEVESSGAMKIERKLIVDGPQLSWQTAHVGEPSESDLQANRDRHRRVQAALVTCTKALRAKRSAERLLGGRPDGTQL